MGRYNSKRRGRKHIHCLLLLFSNRLFPVPFSKCRWQQLCAPDLYLCYRKGNAKRRSVWKIARDCDPVIPVNSFFRLCQVNSFYPSEEYRKILAFWAWLPWGCWYLVVVLLSFLCALPIIEENKESTYFSCEALSCLAKVFFCCLWICLLLNLFTDDLWTLKKNFFRFALSEVENR